jgi:hypothetical protein
VTILDTIERIVPRIRLYPPWAQGLFGTTFAMVLISFFLWVFLSPQASATAKHKSVQLDVGLGGTQTESSSDMGDAASGSGRAVSERAVAASTQSTLEAPIVYELVGRTIRPKVPYLTLVRRGGPLGGVSGFDWWYKAETFPKLDVKLANTGTKTAFLSSASVHVARSVPDLEPIPVVFAGESTSPGEFGVDDEGWGKMEDASFRYDIATGSPRASFGRPGPFVAKLSSDGVIDVRAGIRGRNLPHRGTGTVWGTLAYRWRDATATVRRNSVNAVTTVYLAPAPPTAGAPAPTQGTYDVDLRVSGVNYDVPLRSFDRFIKPQTPDRFAISVHTGRSSIHRGVDVRLRYSDGYVQRSSPVNLRIFMPRNAPSASG